MGKGGALALPGAGGRCFTPVAAYRPAARAVAAVGRYSYHPQLLSLLQNRDFMTKENLLLDLHNNPLARYNSPGNLRGEALSGQVYQDAYKRLITDPKSQLCVPIMEEQANGPTVDVIAFDFVPQLLSLLQNRDIMTKENLLLDLQNDPLARYKSPGNLRGEALSGQVYQDAYRRLITERSQEAIVCANNPVG